MAKVFRSWDVDQGWLLPPSVDEFVPPGHLAHFVRDTVREAFDLSAILDSYTEERGYPPYHPGMMVALLLYRYSRGLYSSRQLARACEERVDVMAVTGLNRPDFRTIADFRKRHLAAFSDLFVQVLRLCRAAGLVQFGHVAMDGTKLKANASRHKAMSYGRMKTVEPVLAAEVEGWLTQAAQIDAAEDHEHGADRRGDEAPDWMADKQRRLEAIRSAKAALEAEAADPPDPEDESGPGASSGMRWQGRPLRGEDGGPPDRAQRNFTDPDSRILPTRDGFVQGYNGQIAVDAAYQVIVAHRLVTTSADSPIAGTSISCSTRPWSGPTSRPPPEKGAKTQALGRSRGGLTTKIHMRADALGRPLKVVLTPGQAHDITAAPALLEGAEGGSVIADRGYDTNEVRTIIAEAGIV